MRLRIRRDHAEREEVAAALQETKRRQPRLLVVEDDHDIRRNLGLLLGDDYELIGLSTGGRILEIMDGYAPDLVILDVGLPGADGFQLCETIRASTRHRHLPVIFLTAQRDDKSFVRCIEVNGDAYIIKPFDANELRDTIERLLTPAVGEA